MAAITPKMNNEAIINAFRNEHGNAYQERVPDPVKAGVAASGFELMKYIPTRNEFTEYLVNRVGMDYVHIQSFRNKLAKFKTDNLVYGDTIEEINIGLPRGTGYDSDVSSLEGEIFGKENPHVRTAFHKINRQEKYKITILEPMLRRAFTGEFGLSNMVTGLMQAQITADELDEFLLMTNLFKDWYRMGGFFRVKVPDVSASSSTAADAKAMLRIMREYAALLQYPETDYNPAKMPIAAMPEDYELFITPGAKAAIDVEALAAAFNVPYAEFDSRTTTIPEKYMPIPGVQAILTTKDFFVAKDTLYQTTLADNPAGLYQNYWLHHHGIYSVSPFVPAIMFWTGEGDEIVISDPVPTLISLSVTDLDGNVVTEVQRGEVYRMLPTVETTPAGGANTAVMYEIEGEHSLTTVVRQSGGLTISLDEEAESLTINGAVIDQDYPFVVEPATVTVAGEGVRYWPEPGVIPEDDENEDDPDPEPIE